jgi:hypothetical protein
MPDHIVDGAAGASQKKGGIDAAAGTLHLIDTEADDSSPVGCQTAITTGIDMARPHITDMPGITIAGTRMVTVTNGLTGMARIHIVRRTMSDPAGRVQQANTRTTMRDLNQAEDTITRLDRRGDGADLPVEVTRDVGDPIVTRCVRNAITKGSMVPAIAIIAIGRIDPIANARQTRSRKIKP